MFFLLTSKKHTKNIAGCVSARFQLALLLLIREFLNIPEERAFVNDPIFFCSEVKLLRRLKLEVISENLECKLKCQVPTIIFLPHCPKQLTNNLLYANWSPEGLTKWVDFASKTVWLIHAQPFSGSP